MAAGKRGRQYRDSIHERGDGWLYVVVRYYDADGQQRQKWLPTGTRSRHEARERKPEIVTAWRRGEGAKLRLPPEAAATVAAQVEAWISHATLSESTRRTYRETARRYIDPHIGAMALRDVDAASVRSLVATLRSTAGQRVPTLSPRVVAAAVTVLRRSLQEAVEAGVLTANPCDGIHTPQKRRRVVRAVTPEQANRLLAAAAGSRYAALFVLALRTGLRIGELLALRWDDVEWNAATLRVERTLDKRTRTPTAPKTPASVRRLALGDQLLGVLREHRESLVVWRAVARERWREHGLVFPSAIGTPVSYSSFVRRQWKPLLERAGLPGDLGLHTLRHTNATGALGASESLLDVSVRLGHADVSTTARLYAHAQPGLDRPMANRMDDLFSGTVVEQRGPGAAAPSPEARVPTGF